MIKKTLKQAFCSTMFRSGLLHLITLVCRPGLTVLMFHRIDKEIDPLGLSISPDFFDSLLGFLVKKHNLISMAQALEDLAGGTLSHNDLVVSFDDGWRDNYIHAFPIIQKYNIPVTIFVTVDAVEKGIFGWCSFDQAILNSQQDELDLTAYDLGTFPLESKEQKVSTLKLLHEKLKKLDNTTKSEIVAHVVDAFGCLDGERLMLSWQEIREMRESGLVSIGSHTVTHPILTRIPLAQARYEIEESKRFIEYKIDGRVDFFAYPNGSSDDFNSDISEFVKDAGYKAAFSTIPGVNRDLLYRFSLRRLDITYGMCQGVGENFSPSMFSVKKSCAFNKLHL